MKAHDLLALSSLLLADGAMGTWFAERTGNDELRCERANLSDPALVASIHREYLDAGARLLRTNTFAANRASLRTDLDTVLAIVAAGHAAAHVAAAGRSDVLVAASIGPVPADPSSDADAANGTRAAILFETVDAHLDAGADFFFFETFSETADLVHAARRVKARRPDAFVAASFSVQQDGRTRLGRPVADIERELRDEPAVDALGLNCGSGPSHLLEVLASLPQGAVAFFLPNSGYPVRVEERTVFRRNPEYFAETVLRAPALGARVLGGCCGTTPEHVRRLGLRLQADAAAHVAPSPVPRQPAEPRRLVSVPSPAIAPGAASARRPGKPVSVEIDPPFDAELGKLLDGVRLLAAAGVQAFTVADSPMGRARLDPVMLAARIQRETGVPTIPHLCCRDRNLNALRSLLLGAHAEGLRRILCVTGDPLPEGVAMDVKPVFNLGSSGLIALVAEMDRSVFEKDPIVPGAAVGVHLPNRKAELARTARKIEAGAGFLMTQPVYEGPSADFTVELARTFAVPVHVGLLPPIGLRNALFLHNEVPGISLPDDVIARFRPDMTREEAEEAGLEAAVAGARSCGPDVGGYFLVTPFSRFALMARLVRRLRDEGLASG